MTERPDNEATGTEPWVPSTRPADCRNWLAVPGSAPNRYGTTASICQVKKVVLVWPKASRTVADTP